MDLSTLLKATALTSSGLFAGYTWALSDAAIPATILGDEQTQASQWRIIYLKGFYISRPLCIINLLTFGFLAYQTQSQSPSRALYILSALLNSSGVPYALTLLRRTNGALAIRAKKLCGPGPDPRAMALTYAFNEERSRKREKEWSTIELVKRWQWHNAVRTWILVVGTVLGGIGVAMDS